MPKSSSGKVAICTLVDAATGFVIVHPCSDKTHAGVIDALRTKVFPNFGCPRLLVTDKGKENMNQEVSKFLKHYHINHITSSTGHPQSNGMVERRQQMIISYFKKLIHSPDSQALWDEALPDFQTIINSTGSASRKHSPFFLTFFRHPHFPFQHLSTKNHSFDESSSVESRLNLSQQILREAADHVDSYHALTKTQFDKNVKDRKFPIGAKVFVQTSQRAGLSKKLAKPFKGPYICIEEMSNGNLKLAPMTGGRAISMHKNNCKLAPQGFQHLLFDDPDPETDQSEPPDPDPFRFSAQDFTPTLDDTTDDTPDGTIPEPNEPPDTNPPNPQDPGPEPEPGPLDPRLRHEEPPGPPRTRAAARAPGNELPAMPGIAHDKLPIERAINKLKKTLQPK